jgi:hypothetical protein
MAREEGPRFRTVAVVTGVASLLSLVLAWRGWSLVVPYLVFGTLCWTGYSFVKFGKRGWWIFVLASPWVYVAGRFVMGFVVGVSWDADLEWNGQSTSIW